jgi:hypothetical protein
VKSLFRILLLTLAFNTYAQERVNFSVLQDARLAILGDDIGNKPFTEDVILRVDMEGNGRRGYISGRLEWEYAALKGGYYNRISTLAGYNWILGKYIVSMHTGPGIIKRTYKKASGGVMAWAVTTDLAYELTDMISLIVSNQILNRADVVNEPIRYSFFGGIKMYFNN